jgi:hypothetical protein
MRGYRNNSTENNNQFKAKKFSIGSPPVGDLVGQVSFDGEGQ